MKNRYILIGLIFLLSCNSKNEKKGFKLLKSDNSILFGEWVIDSMFNLNDSKKEIITLNITQGYCFDKNDSIFLFQKKYIAIEKKPIGKFNYKGNVLDISSKGTLYEKWEVESINDSSIVMKSFPNGKIIRPCLYLRKHW